MVIHHAKLPMHYNKSLDQDKTHPFHAAALKMLSEKYVERKLYRPTHLALLPMNARNSLETDEMMVRGREMDSDIKVK